jgi:serine/threonine protein kinase HipA of HipAB toxin-antitoxin module
MSTVAEIRDALKQLPVQEAQNIAQWLQQYLECQGDTKTPSASQTRLKVPDYATRRRMILGDKVLPNMVLLGREQERW